MSLTDQINELLDSLPDEFEVLIRSQIPLLQKIGKEELKQWIKLIISGKELDALKLLTESLSTEDILEDGLKDVDYMQELNKISITQEHALKEFFTQLATLAIQKYIA
jgi:hypothetical protein